MLPSSPLHSWLVPSLFSPRNVRIITHRVIHGLLVLALLIPHLSPPITTAAAANPRQSVFQEAEPSSTPTPELTGTPDPTLPAETPLPTSTAEETPTEAPPTLAPTWTEEPTPLPETPTATALPATSTPTSEPTASVTPTPVSTEEVTPTPEGILDEAEFPTPVPPDPEEPADPFSIEITGEGEDWQLAEMPKVDAAQVAGFTGAASYSYPLWTPPGPAGLQPSLELVYNSQIIDAMIPTQHQGSWVGAGWNLDTGYIERDMHGTMDQLLDDTFLFVLNGVSHRLLLDGQGIYHTENETFWRFRWVDPEPEKGNGIWYAWDGAGNEYVFGEGMVVGDADDRKGFAYYQEFNGCEQTDYVQHGWKWALTTARNKSGQQIHYYYELNGQRKVPLGCDILPDDQHPVTYISILPSRIVYPNGQYSIEFVTEDRYDYRGEWGQLSARVFHDRKRLDRIDIYRAGNPTPIRSYDLSYDATIFPGTLWNVEDPAGQFHKSFAISQIQEYGVGGIASSNSLDVNFTYDSSGQWLETVTHYLGGSIHFQYAGSAAIPNSTMYRNRVASRTETDGVSGETRVLNYEYDEPAVNDEAHSLDADPSYANPYYPRYAEFRGHAMTRMLQSDDRLGGESLSVTTWYYQDDHRKGLPHTTLTATRSYYNNGSDTSGWTGSPLGFDDPVDPFLSWGITDQPFYRTDSSLSSGDSVALQFRLFKQSNVRLGVSAENSPETYYGLHASSFLDQAGLSLDTPGSLQPWSTPEFTGMRGDTWYVLLLILDDSELFLRVWERDNPANAQMTTLGPLPSGLNWKFHIGVPNGRIYMDEYEEGHAYQLTTTPVIADDEVDMDAAWKAKFPDLDIYWARPVSKQTLVFDGDGFDYATREYYSYEEADQGGAQHGLLTRRVTSQWDATRNLWLDHLLTWTRFFPNVSDDKFLVNFPAYSAVYACDVPDHTYQNGGCSGILADPTLRSALLQSETISLYDNQGSDYTLPPVQGFLSQSRQLLEPGQYADTAYTYDEWGNVQTTTRYSVPGTGSALSQAGAQTTTTCYGPEVYGACGTSLDGADGVYPLWQTNAAGHKTRFAYDLDLGLQIQRTDPNGGVTLWAYDNLGRMTALARPGEDLANPTLSASYEKTAGSPYQVTTRKKSSSQDAHLVTVEFYNGFGELIQSQTHGENSSGARTETRIVDTRYDDFGNPIEQTLPYTVTTASGYIAPAPAGVVHTFTTYDPLGRPLLEGLAGGVKDDLNPATPDTTPFYFIQKKQTYNGLEIFQQDAKGAQDSGEGTAILYDPWGNVLRVTPAEGPAVIYAYDSLNRLVGVDRGQVNGQAIHTAIDYDLAGRKRVMDDPDTGRWEYVYDALGNLVSQTDARGCVVTLQYDSLNRLTRKTYSGTCAGQEDVIYTYDAYQPAAGQYGIGRRSGMQDGSGSTAWVYDLLGRMTAETKLIGADTFLTGWQYTPDDQVSQITYPGDTHGGVGETVQVTYDLWGREASLASLTKAEPLVNRAAYDAYDRLIERAHAGNKILQEYAYYPWNSDYTGRLKGSDDLLQNPAYPDDQQLNLTYTYDLNGNILSIHENTQWNGARNDQTQVFTYDRVDRLTSAYTTGGIYATYGSAQAPNWYRYDPATGNLVEKDGQALVYDDAGAHPHAATGVLVGGSLANQYGYDANGNMASRVVGGQAQTLAYDAENRLTAVSGSAEAEYLYDGDGKLVRSITAEGETTFVGELFEIFRPFEAGTPAATPTPVPTEPPTPVVTPTPTSHFPTPLPTPCGYEGNPCTESIPPAPLAQESAAQVEAEPDTTPTAPVPPSPTATLETVQPFPAEEQLLKVEKELAKPTPEAEPEPTMGVNSMPWVSGWTGYHDGASGDQAAHPENCYAGGWVIRDADNEEDVKIRILIDEVPRYYGEAELYRSDLWRTCDGGRCAYHVDLNPYMYDGQYHSVRVQGQKSTDLTWFDLMNTPKSMRCPLQSGTIRGQKLLYPSRTAGSPASSQPVYLNGGSAQTANPYIFSNKVIGTYTVSVPTLSGYRIGRSVCVGSPCTSSSPITWTNSATVSLAKDQTVYIDWLYQKYQSQSYTLKLYTDYQPAPQNFANRSVTFTWSDGQTNSGTTDANGKVATVNSGDLDPTNLKLTASIPVQITIGSYTYKPKSIKNTTDCVAPSNYGSYQLDIVNGKLISPLQSGDRTVCVPILYERVAVNKSYSVTTQAYSLATSSSAYANLGAVPITFSFLQTGKTTITNTVSTGSDGKASRSQTTLNDVATQVKVTVPDQYTDASGHRKYNFSGFYSLTGCSLPTDWSSWTKQYDVGAPLTDKATSPGYWLGGTYCIGARYAEVPESFTAKIFAYYRDENGTPVPLQNILASAEWNRTIGSSPEGTLVTGADGRAATTQSLLTSTATGLVLTLPVRAGVDAQNSVEFVGFNFLSGQSCDPPGAWNTSWTKTETNSAVSVASPSLTQGGSWCIQAEYQLFPYQTRTHYFFGGQRVATRLSGNTDLSQNGVYYLQSDHLGSTLRVLRVDDAGNVQRVSELRYLPWGEERPTDLAVGADTTDYRYTGQKAEDVTGLYWYHSRWYDPYLNRWTSPDSIIPDPYNPQDWDRYGYCRNNPIRYIDPTGHYTEEEIFSILGVKKWNEAYALFDKGGKYEGMWGIVDILRMANDGDRFLDSMSEFNSNVVGEFRLSDGQLYLDKDGNQTLALPILSSGDYDHTALEQYIPLLGVWGRTATYIHSNSTHSTFRGEFDPAQVDWPGAGLDAAGVVADTLSLGLAGRFTNASKIAYGAGKVIGPVDLAYGAVQAAQQPSFSSGAGLTSDFIGLYVPIIPDIFGLLMNFGNAFHFYP